MTGRLHHSHNRAARVWVDRDDDWPLYPRQLPREVRERLRELIREHGFPTPKRLKTRDGKAFGKAFFSARQVQVWMSENRELLKAMASDEPAPAPGALTPWYDAEPLDPFDPFGEMMP
jgi:hypothetical protein